jgi:hypothetical protein
MSRAARAVCAVALAALVLGGCAGRHRASGGGLSDQRFGVYRGTYVQGDDESHTFRVLLFAALPDRIHAEILPPIGGPRLILDGGGGKLAVTFPGRRLSFVGPVGEQEIGRILGFPISLDDLVGAVLRGAPPPGVGMARAPDGSHGLPDSFELELGGRSLRLELQGTRKHRRNEALGTGAPPPDSEVRPLEDLALDGDPVLLSDG